MVFDLSAYKDRIELASGSDSRLALLEALQHAQLRTIPFENIDPLLGQLPDLSPAAIWQKIVVERRGGYCLELNALLGSALTLLGFRPVPILGRVRMGAAVGGPRAHLAHLVDLDGRTWLCDAGFGGPGPVLPIPIDLDDPVATCWGTFRMRDDATSGETVLDRETPEGWFALYGFDRAPVSAADIAEANVICAQGPRSPFPRHLMMNRVTAAGRVSLFDTVLTDDTNAGLVKRTLAGRADLAEVLVRRFGLPTDPTRDSAIWQRLIEPLDARQTA